MGQSGTIWVSLGWAGLVRVDLPYSLSRLAFLLAHTGWDWAAWGRKYTYRRLFCLPLPRAVNAILWVRNFN